ncbi:hypothetical protein PHMEG_00029005 [Phytophthora megakarya]|uniref:HTH CENPB-type domain-containing protein n=1 Tax=Phytophthora megakarya TaxID=4795 RepID=A0A225V3P4_9STRA|nr:hypothetical protein PHMEG_00029005 [Phytophthora megakarya]
MKYCREVGIATILSRDAEASIVQWVNILRKDGVPISSSMLRLKGKEVAEDLQIADFQGSWHWEKGFLRRHRLSFRARTRQGQLTPDAASEAAINFGIEVQQKMLELHVHKVYNADQTGVFFEYLPKRSVNARGSKTVWVRHGGKDKERVTAMLLGDSEGVKYPPFLVLKSNRSSVPNGDKENWEKRRGFGIHVWKEAKQIMQTNKRCGANFYGRG